MPVFIPIIVIGLAVWWFVRGNWKVRIALFVALAIYLFGTNEAFDLVRTSSTHGNTRHGWYSQYNKGEKFIAMLWLLGFPALCAFGISFLAIPEKKQSPISRRSKRR
jgi:hypothetical protein